MQHDDIQITYENMEASNFSSLYLKSVLKEIQSDAPEGAVVEANVVFHDNFYKGVVHVQSEKGPFFGVVAASNIEELGQRLLVQMKKRLTRWKSKHERN